MAAASGLAVAVDLADLPLSPDYRAFAGSTDAARLAAATAGDDYQLLFALAPAEEPPVAAFRIGAFRNGTGLSITVDGRPTPLPSSLGWQHGG